MKSTNRRVARPNFSEEVLEANGIDLPRGSGSGSAPVEEPPTFEAPPSKVGKVFRAILGVALVGSISSAAAYGARRYVTTTARFAVKDITVQGNARRTEDDVVSEAGVARGANMFTLNLEQARGRLLADPWIRDAVLIRRLPGAVTIQIAEREAAAIVALGDSYLASADGEIFKRLQPGDPTDLPVVTGLSSDALGDDRAETVNAIKRALELAAEYDQSPLASRAPLEEVHVGTDGSLSLVVGKTALALSLGSPPFRKKLDKAARTVAELDRRGTKPDAIFLDNEVHPERVVVRVR